LKTNVMQSYHGSLPRSTYLAKITA